MSEPTLYQRCAHYGDLRMQSIHDCDGYMPVEPCEHGNTGEHVIRDPKRTYHPSELCPGAGIGGDDDVG